MSIATRAHTSRDRPAHVVAGVATSALDRVLAPLADLGAALRAEIAASLAPLTAELEASRGQVSTLESRMRGLEARLATAAAALGATCPGSMPDTTSLLTETGTVAGPQAPAETPTRRKRPRRRPVQDGPIAAPMPVAPMADVPATLLPAIDASVPGTPVRAQFLQSIDNPAPPVVMPVDATTSISPTPETAAGVPAQPSSPTIPIPGSIWSPEHVSGARGRRQDEPAPAQRSETMPLREFAEPASVMSGPFERAASPEVGTGQATRPGARAAPRDRAAGILHPLLEQGAREMIGFGLYPDMEALLNEAVFRLLESDYPTVPDG